MIQGNSVQHEQYVFLQQDASNPLIGLHKGKFLTISTKSKSLDLCVDRDLSLLQCLICRFLENGNDMHASVIAPLGEHQQLARRIVSFLGAYMRVYDYSALEQEILRGIDGCLCASYCG